MSHTDVGGRSPSGHAALPARYEPQRRLGAGGGGEVWSVRDRVSGRVLALKVLSAGAGDAETGALVREAMALSGLEGLGVPRVVAFGTLADGRRYLVRELVEGRSLAELLEDKKDGAGWIEAIASACDELTVVHRAGLLHGDVKPANIIVDASGRGTLVDLGLAAPWRDGGTAAQGLTPKYAAPELFQGEPLTVRAEVYALGATLGEAISARGDDLAAPVRMGLDAVATRATEDAASRRWPSVDELGSALRRAAGLPPVVPSDEPPWPVLGLEPTAQALLARARALRPGDAVAVEGPRGSGRTTLARRLAWALGVEGTPVAAIEAPEAEATRMSLRDVVALEIAQHEGAGPAGKHAGLVAVVDDGDELDAASRDALAQAARGGARLVVVAPRDVVAPMASGSCESFAVPPLEARDAEELVRRAVPSLPDALRTHLVERVRGRPGTLRAAVRRLAGRAIVSIDDVDAALDDARPSVAPASTDRGASLAAAEGALARGRFGEAAATLDALGDVRTPDEQVRVAVARARIAYGNGDTRGAFAALDAVKEAALASAHRRAWETLRARTCVRAGEYAEAVRLAGDVTAGGATDGLAAEALSARGVALAYSGDDTAAREALDEAIRVSRAAGAPRAVALALGSAAIVHQRAGRNAEARAAYEGSLAAAEQAGDAATVASARLNLGFLAHAEGDFAQALAHLEAAVDMGRRAGSRAVVTQALLNLANLDVYLARWARARASLDQLAAARDELSPAARAQLLGLEAELAGRTGELARGARLFEESADAWLQQGRPHDAIEGRLEALLLRARQGGTDARALGRDLDAVRGASEGGQLGEHATIAELVRGLIANAAGDEDAARRAFDAAIDLARKDGRREWAWQALDARARLAAAQGSVATARRDTEAALAMLEETAAKLPRDLREVFWDDPRRRALRQALLATVSASPVLAGATGLSVTTGSPPSSISSGSSGAVSLFTGRVVAEDRLARILEITRELAREHDVPRLLERVTDHAVALLGAERGFVLLVGDTGNLETHAARNRSGDDPHAAFSRSVAERVVATGEPVVTASARDDERLAQAVSVHQLMIQSIACVPIRGAPPVASTIGALYVETRLRPGLRFEQELPTLRAFADQAAIAIENARLLAENRARAEQLAVANEELAAARDELERMLGRRTEQLTEARRDLKQARAELRSHFGYAGLVGTSTAMRRVYALIDRIKDADVPVLITGESGTGKEMVARAVHLAGPRGKRPFLGVNCGAIPANLLESELFGSVRGAFTGADRDRPGLFREADGGTLLLDEIGEMPHKMQAGLLRVLQEKRVRSIGGTAEEPVDVRVIAATNRDLGQMVAEGEFREDLLYRLHVVEIRVPALRERVEDIPPLIDHFLSIFSARYRRDRKTIARDALRKLCAFPWPGNVRQLEHVLLSAWLMSESGEISADDVELPSPMGRAAATTSDLRRNANSPPSSVRASSKAEYKAAERERILSALTACNWNRVQAAKMIGVPRRTFYRRLKEFGIL